MTMDKENILNKLNKKERSRKKMRWVYLAFSLIKFSLCVYIYVIHFHNVALNDHDKETLKMADSMIIRAKHVGIVSMFIGGITFLLLSLKSWKAPCERFALIELLKTSP